MRATTHKSWSVWASVCPSAGWTQSGGASGLGQSGLSPGCLREMPPRREGSPATEARGWATLRGSGPNTCISGPSCWRLNPRPTPLHSPPWPQGLLCLAAGGCMPLGCLTPSHTGWLWVPSAASWGLSPATCWCGLGLEMPRKGWEESLQEELGVGVGGGRATFQRTEAGAGGGGVVSSGSPRRVRPDLLRVGGWSCRQGWALRSPEDRGGCGA